MARPMSKSLYDWCIENDRQDILELWDYTLNKVSPKDVAYRTHSKYWFKCEKGVHPSEEKSIDRLVGGNTKLSCKQCNFYSFKQWCLNNDKKSWLDLWDYELNGCNPEDVAYSSNKKFWFKCPRGLHSSEQKSLNLLTNNRLKLNCNKCNSFGQWLTDTFGVDALEKYWDYKTNKVDPFSISRGSTKKVWIKCLEKIHHESYKVSCCDFCKGQRCSYCSGKKVHPKDSFGQMLIDDYGEDAIGRLWSKRNALDPFKIAPYSHKKVWMICLKDEEHEDYEVACYNYIKGSGCPKCNESHGEQKIRKYLKLHNISFVPQKAFPNLLGIKNGSLTYDFYLPEQNILIEYQGEYHDGTAYQQTEENFLKQQEHDRRKREYAESYNIRLLEIWYWDFYNIETILNKNIK